MLATLSDFEFILFRQRATESETEGIKDCTELLYNISKQMNLDLIPEIKVLFQDSDQLDFGDEFENSVENFKKHGMGFYGPIGDKVELLPKPKMPNEVFKTLEEKKVHNFDSLIGT